MVAAEAVYQLRPLVHVRFGWLRADRIGHLAFECDMFLCEREAGVTPKAVDIFHWKHTPCNQFLAAMIGRKLTISQYSKHLHDYMAARPRYKHHLTPVISRDRQSTRDVDGLTEKHGGFFEFKRTEIERGERELEQAGIPRGAPVVCIHNRDSAYLGQISAADFSYHDYRDYPVEDLRLAVDELVARGYYVVRMGQSAAAPFEHPSPRVIDYASQPHSEFLDVYLSYRAKFFVSTTSGLIWVPYLFRRPIIFLNAIPLGNGPTWGTRTMVLPKLLRNVAGRYLRFDEMIEKAAMYCRSEHYSEAELEVINNSAEEIREAVVEMDDWLQDSWQPTATDAARQQEFRECLLKAPLTNTANVNCAAAFLSRHAELLPSVADRKVA